jgi:superfamily II DNA/RNA helicase
MESKSAQLVFCDTSTPKAGFNVYDELKRLLLTMGIPAQEIAYVHDATSDKKRDELFKQVSQGVIRVLIGSTMKLGLGVNVQSKLIALHHLDVPWRPADMVQREGRIIRPGNTNKAVRIFRYITEGSFDAYSWQLLESKQRFISALLSGSIKERSGSDISDTVLNYAEVKALAIGNPLIKKRVELANELTRLYSLRRKYVENRTNLEQELCELPEKIAKTKILAENCKIDATYYETQKSETTKEERFEIRQQIFDAVCENVMKDTETIFTTYKGFDVVLPAHMPKEKPHLYLQKIGRYYVEIGESEKGVIIRLDNCLEGLSDRYMRLQGSYEQLCRNRQHIVDELSKDEDYEEKINSVKTKLEEIDKKLGVNKK